MSEEILSFVVLAGLAIAVIGAIWLIAAAFRVSIWWGVACALVWPVLLVFAYRHKARAWLPSLVLAVGILLVAAPPIYTRLVPIDLGPREKFVDRELSSQGDAKTFERELHITLTGWDRKDYSILRQKPQTRVLQMANADVDDSVLSYISGMTALRDLDLNDTSISDRGLKSLEKMNDLETLRLRNTKITDAGFREMIEWLPALRQLDLRGTAISGELIKSWKEAKPGRRVMQ
jgi:hypothetical protein